MNDVNPKLDLVLTRDIELAPAVVWRAWTTPALLTEWFCPRPWRTVECEIDLRPGGRFRTVFQSPGGSRHENVGCYLEVTELRRLTWTNALGEGFRPQNVAPGFPMTATIDLAPHGPGTRYTAVVRHQDAAGRDAHAAMGFEHGWGVALDQLIEVMA